MSVDDGSRGEAAWFRTAAGLATLGLILGAVATVAGALTFLSAMGGSGPGAGLGAALAVGMAIGLVILGGVLLLVGYVLRRAVDAIRASGPNRPRPTPFTTWRSALVVVCTACVALSPSVAAAVVVSSLGGGVLPWGTEVVAGVAIAIGVFTAAAAWTSRYLPGRAIGSALVLVALLPSLVPMWMTSQIVGIWTTAQEAAEYRDRYVDLADGPSVGEIVAAVGEVGSWRAISGLMTPAVRHDEWLGDGDAVSALAGNVVRIAVLAQCRVEGAIGQVFITVLMRSADGSDYRPELNLRLGPCDGELRSVTSEPFVLPAWSPDTVERATAGDWILLSVGMATQADEGVPQTGESAVRHVVFLSPDPSTPIEDLHAAVSAAAGSFEVPYSE